MTYIVTHPGGAHLDEILAVGLICQRHGVVPVHRRAPTAGELEDPAVWVVDTGRRHEPALHDFDHHQFLRDAPADCAMSLVARHLGLEELFSARPWYEAQRVLDSKGPVELARSLGLPGGIPAALDSPLDVALTRAWEIQGEGIVDGVLVQLAARLAEALVEEAEAFRTELEACRAITTVITIGEVPVLLHEGPASKTVSKHLRAEWQREHGRVIAASIAQDTRPPFGWALNRFEDDERVDFSRIEGDARVDFAHPRGFIAKTTGPLQREVLVELFQRSLCGPR